MDPITLLMLAAVAWVAAAPDGLTLAGSRGAAGAARSALRAGWTTGRTATAARRATRPARRPRPARGNRISGRSGTRTSTGTRPAGRPSSSSTRPSTTSSSSTTTKATKDAGKASASTSPSTSPASSSSSSESAAPEQQAAAAAAAGGEVPRVVWPTARAAAGAARAGWVQGVTRARAARAAGTDPTSRIKRGVRVAVPVVAAAAAGVRAVPVAGRAAWASTAGTARVGGWRRLRVGHAVRAGLEGGADAWRAARRKQRGAGTDSAGPASSSAPGEDFAATLAAAAAEQARNAQARNAQAAAEAPTGRGPTWVRCEVIPDPAPASQQHDQHDQQEQDRQPGQPGWRVIPGEIVAGPTTTKESAMTSTTSTSTSGDLGLMAPTGGELACLGDLRAEVTHVSGVLEELTPAVGALSQWAAALPERLGEAGWSTTGLAAAIASVSETVGALQCLGGLDDAADGLSIVVRELARAEALGEVADELGASGRVEAFSAE